jgi:hypothetical protein
MKKQPSKAAQEAARKAGFGAGLRQRSVRAGLSHVASGEETSLVGVDFAEIEKRLTPVRTIHFADDGQDFLRWHVAANGVVVCSEPFQSWVWVGYVMMNVRVGRFPLVRTNEGNICHIKHRVTKVEELAHG